MKVDISHTREVVVDIFQEKGRIDTLIFLLERERDLGLKGMLIQVQADSDFENHDHFIRAYNDHSSERELLCEGKVKNGFCYLEWPADTAVTIILQSSGPYTTTMLSDPDTQIIPFYWARDPKLEEARCFAEARRHLHLPDSNGSSWTHDSEGAWTPEDLEDFGFVNDQLTVNGEPIPEENVTRDPDTGRVFGTVD